MSVSKNILYNKEGTFIKKYGYKKPFIKYKIRSFLDFVGFRQPVEYYNIIKRMNFEYKVLKLWSSHNLNVPKVLKKQDNCLYLSKIDGITIDELLREKFDLTIIEKIFSDLEYRHSLSLKENEPLFCHVDSNLRNIMFSNDEIFSIDFEMGREYEPIEKWMEREISKLLVSLLSRENRKNRDLILNKFIEIYSHKKIIENLIEQNLKNKTVNSKIYGLSNVLYDLNDLLHLNKKIEMKSKVDDILIIYSGRFGDILLTTPVLRLLKIKWPNSKITYLTHPKRFEIIENNEFIDTVGFITQNKMSINKSKYDLVIILNKEEVSFVKQALNVSKNVISFRTNNYDLDNKLLYTRKYPLQHSLHSVDMRLSLLKTLTNENFSKKLIYNVTKKESMFVKSFLDKNNLKNKYLIGIQSSSFHTKSFRNWSINNFIKLCMLIEKEHSDIHFLLLGSKDDENNVKEISKKISNSTIVAGKVSFRESCSIMSILNLYVGVDTGPTHVIGTMNIPMVVMYHSFASSNLLMPLENDKFIAIDHPSFGHGNENESMNDISVPTVFEKVNKIIKRKK